jgi:amino acid transporter
MREVDPELTIPSSSPGIVIANTRSVGASLSVWMLSALLAWTGASSYAELGSAIPVNGGAQAYLSYAYGPLISYLYAWTAIIALRPGTLLQCLQFSSNPHGQVRMR